MTDWLLDVPTVALAFATAYLAWTSNRQQRAIEAQLKLAAQEFEATHRSRIRIRHVVAHDGIVADKGMSLTISFTNIGDRAAVISEYAVDLNVIRAGGDVGGTYAPKVNRIDPPLRVGLGQTERIVVGSAGALSQQQYSDVLTRASDLICFGSVAYSDAPFDTNRALRHTGFCRVFRKPSEERFGPGRFVPMDQPDPDYDFED